MLDQNALSQLKSLKQDIQNNTPRFDGIVRGSHGRFGFVNNDQGQSYFLSPEEIEKVLPGDSVHFRVETLSDGKEQAFVERLIDSTLSEFCGRYIVRGKGHFIEADHASLNRWVFVPPAARLNANDGDYVCAKLTKHPFPQGKAQAEILNVLGSESLPGIQRLVMQARFGLDTEFSEAVHAEVAALVEQGLGDYVSERTDLTHLPFVTIDSAGTRDIDDALFAEAHTEGWTLWVAIADPSALVREGSALDNAAQARMTSAYFADSVIPMLPSELSEQLCSLQERVQRLAMVVEIRLAENGSVNEVKLHSAIIESHAKLSYNQVAQFISGTNEDIAAELHGPLLYLSDCAKALHQWREDNALVMEERPDYKLVLDETGQVQNIVRIERNLAHKLVEECMLVCNRSVALWLKERQAGFFIQQKGIRTERHGEAAMLLKEQLNLDKKPSLHELNEYVALVQQASKLDSELPVRTILSRQMDRSQFGQEATPHMGLGFECYTTFTSPLRKYNDLLIHRTIKSLLQDNSNPLVVNDELMQRIQNTQNQARQAANLAEQWLKLAWLAKQDKEQSYSATIVHMNSNSITVRFDDTGIEGSIDRRKAKDWTFDSKTMTHSKNEERFVLNQALRVIVQEVIPEKRSLKLRLA
ncbi:MAG: VacB/RNase II family 3'-5' exoribonuclease [Oleibacter sp.]|nr:VacB/RNase II family 3'-5' exoribonuclease [Thalassolituus sp.]